MQNVNYIKHLKGVFIQFSKDNRLNPTHISLYIALFQIWNSNRFLEEFYINREEVMRFSKIGSKSTYHKCIKDLSHWKYIIYFPSHNPYKGSKIKMFKFGTSTGQALVHNSTNIETSSGQALVSINKHIQTNRNNKNINKLDQPKNENEVINFFKNEKWPEIEAKKFFNHYQGIGWRVGGKTKIVNWQATAKNWMIKAEEILSSLVQSRGKNKETQKAVDQNMDNLKTSKNKNYNEPL
jgi:ribosomal protein L22